MSDTPTTNLWTPIVGADLVATIPGGPITIDVPITLAAGVAADCGIPSGAIYLQTLIEAALRLEPSLTVDAIDERLSSEMQNLGWPDDARRTVTIRTFVEPDSITVVVTTSDPLDELVEPDFPTIKSVPGWSWKTTGLREPVCSPWRDPAVTMVRVGGRLGWGMRAGRTITGSVVKTSASDPDLGLLYTLSGWPQIVIIITTAGEPAYIDVEWDLADRAAGEVARTRLIRAAHPLGWRPATVTAPAPATTKAVGTVAPPEPEPTVPERTMDRLMVSSGHTRLVQFAEDAWEVTNGTTVTQFEDPWEAILAFERHIGSSPVTYHVDIDELLEVAEGEDVNSLFLYSPDGRYRLAGLWMPARAAFEPDKVMTHIGTYGKWGYYVHLYRWNKTYLYSWDEGWETRQVGWHALGTITRKAAIELARADARSLRSGIDEDPLGE